jgi:cell wall-associated NlpC family hydrolase
MHRAKHRAAGGAGSEVSAVALLERFAVVPGPRVEGAGPRHGATAPSPGGSVLFGSAPYTAPMLVVPAAEAPTERSAPLFGGAAETDAHDGSPFGAARHARSRPTADVPGPRLPSLPLGTPTLSGLRVRPQPVGAALSVTVLGAAAAVTAVVSPAPTVLETTGTLAPVQNAAPVPAVPLGPVLAAPAPAALPDQPTVQIKDLVSGVTAQMRKAGPAAAVPYTMVANKSALTSPAALRRAAMTNALDKLGTPYRWGATGPNAFDCSGLVKWSFAKTGRVLPRTSRAMASVGVPVRKADLQPGDLVFFYQPISHVGIYIGNGKIVHASQSGQPVKISDISRMRFTTARRV